MDLSHFKQLIRQRCGLLFEDALENKLREALQQRIAAVTPANPQEYFDLLIHNNAEFNLLVNSLTINETYFFREPAILQHLVEHLAPQLLARRGDQRPVRILSAGCSSGEEPYSILIALQERYRDTAERLFEIHATDIDSRVIEKARQGRYQAFSFRSLSAELKQRYFHADGDSWQVSPNLRQRVQFAVMNLLQDPLPHQRAYFDVIFFRNVSIYFDRHTRILIQRHLATMLKPHGHVITGLTETLANDLGVLRLVEADGLFYFALPQEPQQAAQTAMRGPPETTVAQQALATPPGHPILPVIMPDAPGPQRARENTSPLQRARDLIDAFRYDDALPLLDALLGDDPLDDAARILRAHVLLNRNAADTAAQEAETVLAHAPWSIDALLIQGLAARLMGAPERAIARFKQAVYSQQQCWPAHYYLADLYRKQGDSELARRRYRTVLQLTEQGRQPLTGITTLPLELPLGKVRMLCQHHLEQMAA